MDSRKTRIVLARPDHLGDVVLMLPAAAALRRALPTVHLTFMVASGTAAIPQRCPDIDEVLIVPFPSTWPGAPVPDSWASDVDRQAATLRGRFDIALLVNVDDPWSGSMLSAAGVPARFGFAHPRTTPFLTAALPAPAFRHVTSLAIDLVMMTANFLGLSEAITLKALETPNLTTTAEDEAEASAVLMSSTSVCTTDPLFVLHPGSSWPLKNWPPEHWGELATALYQRYGAPLLVTGNTSEATVVDAVLSMSSGRVYGLAGRLSLGGLAALYRRARLIIATDSGPLHLATALGVPAVGLFGPGDPRIFGPWAPKERYRIVHEQLPCAPCGTVWDPPCGAHAEPASCVMAITLEAVLTAVSELLDGERF